MLMSYGMNLGLSLDLDLCLLLCFYIFVYSVNNSLVSFCFFFPVFFFFFLSSCRKGKIIPLTWLNYCNETRFLTYKVFKKTARLLANWTNHDMCGLHIEFVFSGKVYWAYKYVRPTLKNIKRQWEKVHLSKTTPNTFFAFSESLSCGDDSYFVKY